MATPFAHDTLRLPIQSRAMGALRRISAAAREATEDYCRVAFESLGVTPMGA